MKNERNTQDLQKTTTSKPDYSIPLNWWCISFFPLSNQDIIARQMCDPRAYIVFDYSEKEALVLTGSAREIYRKLNREYEENIKKSSGCSKVSDEDELNLLRRNFKCLQMEHEVRGKHNFSNKFQIRIFLFNVQIYLSLRKPKSSNEFVISPCQWICVTKCC